MPPHPVFDHPLPLAIAHRGGALEAEENTPGAFEHAIGLGYRFVETDVQASADGVAVVFHDDRLERMTEGRGRVDARPWAELSRLRTKGGAAIPRLDAVLDAYPSLHFILEAKSDAAVAPMADAIRRTAARGRVCVGSFRARRTARLRRLLGPDLAHSPAHLGIAQLWFAGWGLPLAGPRAAALQLPLAWRGIPLVRPRLVRAAHARGLQLHVWTVNDTAMMEWLIGIGVDGVITDRPSELKRLLQRRGQWTGGP